MKSFITENANEETAKSEGDFSDHKSTTSRDSDKDKTVNAEVLLFGEKLESPPLGDSIELLSSDEDSTEGEEEKCIGK